MKQEQLLEWGPNIKTTYKKKNKENVAETPGDLENKVYNCLNCGKIYDCRAGSSSLTGDARRFMTSGGICTFCNKVYNVIERDVSSQKAAKSRLADEKASEELRDKLVKYDRESSSRTVVIDDQNDYYITVDSNAWLSEEEREQLRAQIKEEEDAAANRKNTRKVTIDLLGRRVLIADDTRDEKCKGDEASVLFEVAKSATMAEKPRGGGASVVGHNAAAAVLPLDGGGNEETRDGLRSFTRSTYLFIEPEKAGSVDSSRRGKSNNGTTAKSSLGGIVDYDEDLSQLGFVQS